jgi:hypothetical protein
MEQLIRFHTPKQFFSGDPPANVAAYITQFQICMAAAASTAGANRRSGRSMALSNSGPKVLDPASPVLELFKLRCCDNASLFNFDLALVERILDERFTVVSQKEEVGSDEDKPGESQLTEV